MWMSVLGMYEYDNSLFDGLDLPTYTDKNNNVHVIDKNKVINNILLKCAELEILYTRFDTLKLAIGVWSAANQETWSKLYATQMIQYNPIWNVDAVVTIDRDVTNGGDNTDSVQGFNSTTWANSDKSEFSSTSNEDVTETRQGNIGVTASQDLIKKEREVAEFNIIDYIAESFKKRFCLLVY